MSPPHTSWGPLRRYLSTNTSWLSVGASLVAAAVGIVGLWFTLDAPPSDVSSRIDSGGGEIRFEGPVVQSSPGTSITIEMLPPELVNLLRGVPEIGAQVEQILRELQLGAPKIDAPASLIERARLALEVGDTQAAEELYAEQGRSNREEGQSKLNEAAKAFLSAGALAFLRNTTDAIAYYREATRLDPGSPEAWSQLGLLYQREGNLDAAMKAHSRVLDLAALQEDPVLRTLMTSAARRHIGLIQQTLGRTERAASSFAQSLSLDQAAGNLEATASDHGNLGNLHRDAGRTGAALAEYEQSRALHERAGSRRGIARDLANIATVHGMRDDHDKALSMQKRSLAINRDLGDLDAMASNYAHIAIAYHELGAPDEAISSFDKAFNLHERIGNREGMAAVLLNRANLVFDESDLGEAGELYDRALELFTDVGAKRGVLMTLLNRSSFERRTNDVSGAVKSLERALEIAVETGDARGIALIYANLGGIAMAQGDTLEAIARWEQALPVLDGMDSPEAALVRTWISEAQVR